MKFFRATFSLDLRILYHLVLRAAVKKPPQVKVIATEKGSFSGMQNDALFKQLIKSGTNEEHFVNLVSILLSQKDVALDLGGNIGTHSITMSKIVRKGKVFTFEPQSLTFSILQNNILLQECENVVTYRFACSDENYKTISMEPFDFSGDDINNGSLRVDLNRFNGDLALTRKIDSFNFRRINFIKIDIQGSEVKALKGAKDTISKCRPYMFIEIEEQHLRVLATSAKELIELILSFDYSLYRVENSYPCDHICVPIEKVETFEKAIAPKLKFKLSKKIFGKKVDLVFAKKSDQNYESIKCY